MGDSDREYVRQCLDGHPEAYEELVRRHQSALITYLGGKTHSRDRAEEAAQEAFVRSFFALRTLRKPESFFSWLVGIAGRVLKEGRREQRGNEAAAQRTSSPPASQDSVDYDLEGAIAGLPAKYRDVILLRYYEGLSCAQIGEQSGLPVGTVTKRLSRAYGMLKKRLATQGCVGRGEEDMR